MVVSLSTVSTLIAVNSLIEHEFVLVYSIPTERIEHLKNINYRPTILITQNVPK